MTDDAVAKKAAAAKKVAAAKKKAQKEADWPFPAKFREPKVTEHLDALKGAFPTAITTVGDMAGKPVAYVDPTQVKDVLRHARHEMGFDHLPFVSACDYKDNDILELHWQLYNYDTHADLVIKAHYPRTSPEVPSVVDLWAGADWHEREAFDMFGIRFRGHPHLTRIFMPDGWRGYPLLKDYDRKEQYIGMNDRGDDVVFDTPGPYRW